MGQVKPSSAVCATINLGFIDFKLISITHFSRENICIFEALSSLWFEWDDDDDDESNTRLNLNVCGHDILCTRESLAIERRRLALNNFLTWCCFSLSLWDSVLVSPRILFAARVPLPPLVLDDSERDFLRAMSTWFCFRFFVYKRRVKHESSDSSLAFVRFGQIRPGALIS